MQAVCPITDKRINEQVARLNAFVTVLLTVTFIVFNFTGGIVFMMIDFAIRGFIDSKYSPICQLNKWIAAKLNFEMKMLNAGPKIFAAQVGFFLCLFIIVFAVLQLTNLALVFAGILAFFSFLESAFSYCVACKLYPFVRSLKK